MSTVIKVENLSKQYRLGDVGTGSIAHDVNRAWHKLRGKEDPYLKIGESNDRTQKGNSDYVWALKDINFEVKQGEVLGIIGRNGAGKSTLLKILSRTTTPTTGNVKLKGRVASLLEVGTGFHPELSGRENIFLNGAIMGMTKQEIKRKFDEIVDFAGVERYIDTPVKRYSSGMYVRLAFGVAAHLEPEILIVDEVLAVGDAEFQKKALGKMKDVSEKEGRTVLFVSHNIAAMKELCTRGLLMHDGLITNNGQMNKVLNIYLSKESSEAHYVQQNIVGEKGNFHKIFMYSEAGKNTNTFEAGSSPYLIIEYSVRGQFSQFNVGMMISNAYTSNIYSSADTDLNPELLEKKQEGYYKVRVPLNLYNLNTGIYTIRVLMGVINLDLFDSIELNFSIENNNFMNTGTRSGILLALNKWDYYAV